MKKFMTMFFAAALMLPALSWADDEVTIRVMDMDDMTSQAVMQDIQLPEPDERTEREQAREHEQEREHEMEEQGEMEQEREQMMEQQQEHQQEMEGEQEQHDMNDDETHEVQGGAN